MRSLTLLASRLVLGSYLAVHGAQKLFGAFGGHGLDATAEAFDGLGLTPGRTMAALAGGAEISGGVLTATGAAFPLGPLTLMGTMAVAATTHRTNGPLSAKGGFELPLTNLACAAALAVAGPGRLRLGPRAPRWAAPLAVVGGGAMAAWSISKLLAPSPAQRGAVADRSAAPDAPSPAPTTAEANEGAPSEQ